MTLLTLYFSFKKCLTNKLLETRGVRKINSWILEIISSKIYLLKIVYTSTFMSLIIIVKEALLKPEIKCCGQAMT